MSTHVLCDCEYDSEDEEINIINIVCEQQHKEEEEVDVDVGVEDKEVDVGVEDKEEEEERKEVKVEDKEVELKLIIEIEEKRNKVEEKQKNSDKKEEKDNSELIRKIIFKLDLGKMYPIMSCNIVGAICIVMEQIETLDIPNEEKRKMVKTIIMKLDVIDDSRQFIIDKNMLDNIIDTIINCTRNKYEINSSKSRVTRFLNKFKSFKFEFDFDSLARKCKKQ
jgi:hypothetical protein